MSRSSRAQEAHHRPAPPRARPVLVIDDDPTSRSLIGACLSQLCLANPVVELDDGALAIWWLQRCVDADAPRPVLVLLDLRMPGTSGRDVFCWMRDTAALAAVPVIVLTADDDAESVVALYRLGVRSYLVKPVGFAALATVIRELDVSWMLT